MVDDRIKGKKGDDADQERAFWGRINLALTEIQTINNVRHDNNGQILNAPDEMQPLKHYNDNETRV